MSTHEPAEWSPPQRFDGFEIVQPIGRGGMGVVYLARDLRLGRSVALKIESRADRQLHMHDRFGVEVHALARIQHPNVVAIYSAGKVSGRSYLAQELLVGQRLDQLHRPMPWRRVLGWGRGLARAVSAAHAAGVLRRDIKPGNVMLVDDHRVKLFDFGLAWLVDHDTPESVPRLTAPGTVVGTPAYVAPELWLGGDPDILSDVYAIGLSLYELLAGELPHANLDPVSMKAELLRREMRSIASRCPQMPQAFATVIDRCVSRDPAARPQSAAALRTALDELAADRDPRGGWRIELEPDAADHESSQERGDLDGLRTQAMPLVPSSRSVG
jgi:serine/threonine protein kinase